VEVPFLWSLGTPTVQDSLGQFRNWPVVFSVLGKAHSAQEFSWAKCLVKTTHKKALFKALKVEMYQTTSLQCSPNLPSWWREESFPKNPISPPHKPRIQEWRTWKLEILVGLPCGIFCHHPVQQFCHWTLSNRNWQCLQTTTNITWHRCKFGTMMQTLRLTWLLIIIII